MLLECNFYFHFHFVVPSSSVTRDREYLQDSMNIRIPLWSFRDLNGILKFFLKVAAKNAQ